MSRWLAKHAPEVLAGAALLGFALALVFASARMFGGCS